MLIRKCGSNGQLLLVLLSIQQLLGWSLVYGPQEEPDSEFSHTVIKLAKRDDELARRLARDMGMVVRGEPFLDDKHYFISHADGSQPSRRKRSVLAQLNDHPDVEWIREDKPKRRSKRDYLVDDSNDRAKRQSPRRALPIPKLPFPDPLYNDQWYLTGRAVGGFDMNTREAWLLGYAGRNVSISILDDGIQRDHPDLVMNYDPQASTDINDHDDDPTPQNNGDNKHGTRCAGEVAATAGNNVCGVGVAYHSKIGGVRMLDGPVSDSVEAASLTLRQNYIDIYSASWGPEDDGKTFDGPGALAQEAFYRGIKQGRGGRGNIFVWASGNGGSRQDSCSADGYTTSIYTLSISSATFDNRRPWYLEECPSTIATTYSSANINQPAIVTVDVPSGCTKMHTGTSASAPLAAGIIALALEANPMLTWRDTQHVVLRTANPTPLLNNAGWSVNGVGRRVSNKFGYGLMDAGALVRLAREWKTVPEQHMCTYEYTLERPNPRPVVGRFKMNFSLDVTGCAEGTPVLYLEHVQVVSTIRYQKRGDLKLTLYSPSGTESVLLPPRPQDFNQNGFHKWPFLSVQTWGEDPRGTWILTVESVTNNLSLSGMVSDWTLLLYGTSEPAQPTDPRHSAEPLQSKYRPNAHSQQVQQSLTSQTVTSGPELDLAPNLGNLETADKVSAGNCHPECNGCSASEDPKVQGSATSCFACKHFTQALRSQVGFKCVSKCDEGFYADGDKCKKCSSNCASCSEAERCLTCHGALLLIHTPTNRIDQGHCVQICPLGLRADFSHATQARCMIKASLCENGYYEGIAGKCQPCDEACKRCHGPGPLECLECAPGYGNGSTMGYCRPCCKGKDTPESTQHRCEDCTKLNESIIVQPSLQFGHLLLTSLFILLVGFACYYGCVRRFLSRQPRDTLEYAPLRTDEEQKTMSDDEYEFEDKHFGVKTHSSAL
ncbi:CRE-BLI-4 protein [Aphelenchoides bicaudatus]|nr:CRE-BLI-4 protein [Aphelenchoides bicaudatus]